LAKKITVEQRLGCSLSTVKRHLRRELRDPTTQPPVPTPPEPMPTVAEVLAAAGVVTSSPLIRRRSEAA
jgi:hypothetical protein